MGMLAGGELASASFAVALGAPEPLADRPRLLGPRDTHALPLIAHCSDPVVTTSADSVTRQLWISLVHTSAFELASAPISAHCTGPALALVSHGLVPMVEKSPPCTA